jgi:DNA polymerase-4
MYRDILHIHIPNFPTALAQATTPRLRNRPVAIAPTHSERAVIQCASPEARAEGIYEGTPVYRALRLCGSLEILAPDPRLLSSGVRSLGKITRHYSPLWEPAAPGRIFLDLTGSGRLLGPGRDAALRLERQVKADLSLPGAVGVAANKLVSRIASGYLEKPGVCDVSRGSEDSFIAPLPVITLPGVGKAREQVMLQDLNLKLIGEVACLTVPQLALPFGAFAPLLHQRSRGIDPTPVMPPRRSPAIREETWLPEEENEDQALMAALYLMAEGCGLRLRRAGAMALKLTLEVTWADGQSARRTEKLSLPANSDNRLFSAAESLFERACLRRVRVKAMSLECSSLAAATGQMELYPDESGDTAADQLQAALDSARSRYGRNSVKRGCTIIQSKIQNVKSKT